MITIYRIRNKANDKIYIGIDSKYPWRFKSHMNGTGNKKIASALKEKYTPDDFELHSLTQVSSRKLANWLEEYYIWYYDSIKTGYNLREGGDSGTHSEETRRKLSAVCKGKKRSAETRAKMSATRKGNPLSSKAARKGIETKRKNGTIGNGGKALKGQKRSPEATRQGIETRRKNGTNKGWKVSPESIQRGIETKRKNGTIGNGGKAHKGKKLSAETRAKISAAKKGKKTSQRTPEHKLQFELFE